MNLTDADRLLAWMRQNGVVSARVGDVALVVGEQPGDTSELETQKPRARRRYENPEDDPALYGAEDGAVPGFLPVKGD